LFARIKPYVRRADLALCQVETPMTSAPPTSYPVFNTPPELATAIHQTGWRACSTASNHALDQEPPTPTTAQMLTVASVLRGCTTTITRLGRPSNPRLLPVYEPMVKACAQFARAAKCQTTLAVSQDYGQLSKAATCMSTATSTGGTEMAAASQAIFNLQNLAG
jgi:hypothetical protein